MLVGCSPSREEIQALETVLEQTEEVEAAQKAMDEAMEAYDEFKADKEELDALLAELESNEELIEEEVREDVADVRTEISDEDLIAIESLLVNPQTLRYESIAQMSENQGIHFEDSVEKIFIENCMQMFASGDDALVRYDERIQLVNDDGRPQQAAYFKFGMNDINNLRFTFIGMAEVVISYEDGNWYCTYVQNFTKVAFASESVTDIEMKENEIYNIVVAFDEEARLHCLIWEEENIDNQIYYEEDLYIGADDIFESNYSMSLGFNGNGQFDLYEYGILTFDGYNE